MNDWTQIEQDSSYVAYAGPYPKRLYRYRSISPSTVDRLLNFEVNLEAIYLAALDELNDPDDGRFIISFPSDARRIRKYWLTVLKGHPLTPDRKTRQLEAIRRTQLLMKSQGRLADAETCNMVRATFGRLARVACFSTNPTNYSMWANYAKYEATNGNVIGHAGVCIEYNCDSTWSNLQLRPITYIDDVPIVYPTLQSDAAVADALYTKSREWRGEDEWRISSVIATTPPLAANFAANSKIRIEGGVSSIIFGINTPPDVISEFMGRCTLPYIKYLRVARNAVTHVRTVQPLA